MSNTTSHVNAKTYTKVGKWYNIIYLGISALGTIVPIASGITTGTISVATGLLLAIPLLIIAALIVGILNEKRWAKWVAITLYGLVIFGGLRAILTPSLAAFEMFNTTAFKVGQLVALAFPALGIIFLLQKPRTNSNPPVTEAND